MIINEEKIKEYKIEAMVDHNALEKLLHVLSAFHLISYGNLKSFIVTSIYSCSWNSPDIIPSNENGCFVGSFRELYKVEFGCVKSDLKKILRAVNSIDKESPINVDIFPLISLQSLLQTQK